MSEEQLAAIVDALGGLLGLLRRADQHDRAEIYTRTGLQMIYRPGTETVLAEVRSNDLDHVPEMCPEPELNPNYMFRMNEDLLLP
jgi:site-specific DNA recombinase